MSETVSLFMYASARVRAPAIIVVVGLMEMSEGVVSARRPRRLLVMASSTRRKGRYLFASSEAGRLATAFPLIADEALIFSLTLSFALGP